MVLPFPIFAIPGAINYLLDRKGLSPKTKAVDVTLQLSILTFALWFALPVSVAVFPQNGEIGPDNMEVEFKEMKL